MTAEAAAQAPPAAAAGADNPADPGEPLPPGAPTQPYELAAWCYGAMDQYLYIYSVIIPELRDIDRRFGSSVKNETRPYASDMAAARQEVKLLANAVTAAEKASATVIAPRGVEAVKAGRAIWIPAEAHTRRELARAWLSWALPDRCALNARELTANSELLGRALKYNGPSATEEGPAPVTAPPAGETAAKDAAPPAEEAPPVAAPPAGEAAAKEAPPPAEEAAAKDAAAPPAPAPPKEDAPPATPPADAPIPAAGAAPPG
ncbi:MAG TPA: hypothetical protein VG248_15065 [Caulobacteraceae bacterium]|nr:hypothetical protein [Caulobacteraceae bacterium]